MNTRLLVLFCCCYLFCLNIEGIAQTVFAPQGATWRCQETPGVLYWRYASMDSVTINGHPGHHITGREHNPFGWNTSNDYLTTYMANDTVFYANYGRYIPLYIMNVHVGDTVAYYKPNYPASWTSNIDSFFHVRIDSVKMVAYPGSALLKTVFARSLDTAAQVYANGYATWAGFGPFNNPGLQYYADRIGIPNGIGLLPLQKNGLLEGPGKTTCYFDGTNNVLFSEESCSATPASIPKVGELPRISLVPNPSTDNISLNFDQPIGNDVFVSIKDITGKQVRAATIARGASTYGLNIAALAPGVYVVSATINGMPCVARFLKN